jgi:hypothetical protein
MADFRKSLEAGLAANADATAKRAEINSVVREVSNALADATDGVVGLELRAATREKVRHLTNMIARMTGEDKEISYIQYTALCAHRLVDPKTAVEIAEFELEPTAYPVLITSSGVNAYAHDRESLERIVAGILEHPDTGGKIQRLIDTPSKPKPVPSSGA